MLFMSFSTPRSFILFFDLLFLVRPFSWLALIKYGDYIISVILFFDFPFLVRAFSWLALIKGSLVWFKEGNPVWTNQGVPYDGRRCSVKNIPSLSWIKKNSPLMWHPLIGPNRESVSADKIRGLHHQRVGLRLHNCSIWVQGLICVMVR